MKKGIIIISVVLLLFNFFGTISTNAAAPVLARVAAGTVGERVIVGMAEKSGYKFVTKKARERAVEKWNMEIFEKAQKYASVGDDIKAEELSRFQSLLANATESSVETVASKPNFGKFILEGALFLTGLDIVVDIAQEIKNAQEFAGQVERMTDLEYQIKEDENITSWGGLSFFERTRDSTTHVLMFGDESFYTKYVSYPTGYSNLVSLHTPSQTIVNRYLTSISETGTNPKVYKIIGNYRMQTGPDRYANGNINNSVKMPLEWSPKDYSTIGYVPTIEEVPEVVEVPYIKEYIDTGIVPDVMPDSVTVNVPIESSVPDALPITEPFPWNEPIGETTNPEPNPEPNPDTSEPFPTKPPENNGCAESPVIDNLLDWFKFNLVGDVDCYDSEKLKMSGGFFTTKFPFSLPWDVGRALTAVFGQFDTENIPSYTFTIYGHDFEIKIPDMMINWFPITRGLILIAFDIGLIYSVRKLLGGAS